MPPRIHPTQYNWGARRGRPWTDDHEICARFLRHCGLNNAQIGAVLHRTEQSVTAKIGYQKFPAAEAGTRAAPAKDPPCAPAGAVVARGLA